jgi:hypothetical protein
VQPSAETVKYKLLRNFNSLLGTAMSGMNAALGKIVFKGMSDAGVKQPK